MEGGGERWWGQYECEYEGVEEGGFRGGESMQEGKENGVVEWKGEKAIGKKQHKFE